MSEQATAQPAQPAQAAPQAAAQDWRTVLPEDIRSDETFSKFKSIGDLAKSYKEAQGLIGRKRLELRREDWKPEQHEEFWKTLGRPDKPEAYTATAKSEHFTPDEKELAEAKAIFHKAGLTTQQGQAILDYYVNSVGSKVGSQMESTQGQQAAAMESLKQKWGDNYEIRLATARHFFKQFANPELVQHLEQTGLGNDPRMAELFYNISKLKGEDNSSGGGAITPIQGGADAAKAKLKELRANSEFLKQLTNRQEPGHAAALELWNGLHKQSVAA